MNKPKDRRKVSMGKQRNGTMECPDCKCRDLRVWMTRAIGKNTILRVRICRACGYRMETIERGVES